MEDRRVKSRRADGGSSPAKAFRRGLRRESANGNRLVKPKRVPTDRSKFYVPPPKPKRAPVKAEKPVRVTSVWQVGGGRFEGKEIVRSDSPKALPTSLKTRELAFKPLVKRIKLSRFLDIGSGCGIIGIEAISRGAMLATMVERSAKFCSAIRTSLEKFEIKPGHGEVVEIEAEPYLRRAAKRRRQWDIIFLSVDDRRETEVLLGLINAGTLLVKGGQLLVETKGKRPLPEEIGRLRRWREADSDGRHLTFFTAR